jgi:hypothetical protein
MAGKLTAIGSNFYIGTADLSGDVGAVTNASTPLGTFSTTAIDKGAEERIPGRKDGALGFMAFFNDDSGQSHETLSALPRTDQLVTLVLGTPALASPAGSMPAKQLDYAIAAGEDGSLGVNVQAAANGFPLEWSGGAGGADGLLTTGKQSFPTGTQNGTSINLGATDTAFGAAAYIHVFTMPSGTATFAVQDSDDDSTFVDVTGLVFTALTGPGSERKQTAAGATVRQYVRLQGRGTHGTSLVVCNFIRYTEPGPI